jgi:two-component system, cell cycle sensor histidine kinase and response regulator CckA
LAVALGSQHQLVIDLGKRLPNVKIDPIQIEQVLMNLVVNARDAMPSSGKVTLTTSFEGNRVCLAVSDTGTGMDEATQRRAFEPFFTTKQLGKGSGLGLPMVLGIIQQHHGEIILKSAPGKGTTFLLYFPATDELAESDLDGIVANASAIRVLLVDDEDALRSALEGKLMSHGFKVIAARNGAEAMAVGEEQLRELDVVVTDVHMPEMDGRELVRRLVAVNPKIKVLFMSGNSGDSEIEGIDKNSKAFLPKPFSGETLRKRIEELLG